MGKVLVMDDDPQILNILERILGVMKCEVITAKNGKDGMDLFRSSPTDIVITDIDMPIKDGLDVIKELKEEFPNTPILAISGAGGKISGIHPLDIAKEMGARTLTKPFEMDEFLSSVKELSPAS